MPEFVCRLGAPDGSVVERRRVSASIDALRRELEGEGYHIFSLSGARSRFRLPLFSRSERVSGQDFLLFNTQLRTLLRAGLPLAQSLELLKQQQTNAHFGALLRKVDVMQHFQSSFVRGALDTADVVFFLAWTGVFLFLATRILEARRWW